MDLEHTIVHMGEAAKKAARVLANTSTPAKNQALLHAAARLRQESGVLLAANLYDLELGRKNGLSAAMLDRLTLTEPRIEAMAKGLELIADLPDPVGETLAMWRRPNGLEIGQVRVPLGVVGVIYESRPNVTADAAGLCLKAGNAVILKGGSEAFRTNAAIVDVLTAAAVAGGLPEAAIQFVRSTDRQAVALLLQQHRYVDVIIPRGGEELIRAVSERSAIPVIQHFSGICHTYVDARADLEKAARICFNAKVQRPWVCNAMENLLVHEEVAARFLPQFIADLEKAGVEIRGCERTRLLAPHLKAASEEDWRTEYLDLILAVKIVGSLDEAIDFINTNGSGLADAIVSEDYSHVRRFLREVDSATVYANASTRFTDGYEFGFGAEVGISTNRLHARGPMGLRELTTYKYVIYGSGQVRD
ncbi:MAG TPA: glutamate-5-semialdehyde dehydrogenase [Candidatus Binatia bacterium]|nr:glutamate-5-semialdehyde dehydrogenase [Candidatus Binatia bacterium]